MPVNTYSLSFLSYAFPCCLVSYQSPSLRYKANAWRKPKTPRSTTTPSLPDLVLIPPHHTVSFEHLRSIHTEACLWLVGWRKFIFFAQLPIKLWASSVISTLRLLKSEPAGNYAKVWKALKGKQHQEKTKPNNHRKQTHTEKTATKASRLTRVKCKKG